MLETFIHQLGLDLEMEDFIDQAEPGRYRLFFADEIEVEAALSPQSLYQFKSIIGACPQENVEVFLIKAMEANLFGRGTRGAAIGLKEEGNLLTLSLEVDYNSTYKEWKDKLQDFITALDFWRKEALTHR